MNPIYHIIIIIIIIIFKSAYYINLNWLVKFLC